MATWFQYSQGDGLAHMMNKTLNTLTLLLLICSLDLMANVGTVLFAKGDTRVERGNVFKINKGDIIERGDTLLTGDNSRLQVLFTDNARLSLRPNSVLRVEDYIYQSNEAITNTEVSSENNSALNLMKGGFRTITGAISAGDNKTNYRVTTAVATIGIRGTDYSILLCDDDCDSLVYNSDEVANGLYAGVSQGAIVLFNDVGELQLNETESGFVSSAFELPVKLLGPPQSLFGQTTPTSQSEKKRQFNNSAPYPFSRRHVVYSKFDDSDEQEEDVDLVIAKAIVDEEGNEIIIDNGRLSFGAQETLISNGIEPFSSSALTFDSNGSLTSFYANDAYTRIGSANNINLGYDPNTGFKWGRWHGGTAFINNMSTDLSNESLHWLINTSPVSDIALVQTGTAQYSLVGNTDPTNLNGDKGVVGSAAFSANFTTQVVTTNVSLGIAGDNWVASGSGSIAQGLNQFSGNYDTVLINNQINGGGNFIGFFSPTTLANGIPSGAGLSYNLHDNDFERNVNGVLIFGKPE